MNIRAEEIPSSSPRRCVTLGPCPFWRRPFYRELKQSGLSEEDIMGVASSLSQVAGGLRARSER
ncbi:MAG: hypothetical protein R3F14_07545 [Polyangiaceae bacterium]